MEDQLDQFGSGDRLNKAYDCAWVAAATRKRGCWRPGGFYPATTTPWEHGEGSVSLRVPVVDEDLFEVCSLARVKGTPLLLYNTATALFC